MESGDDTFKLYIEQAGPRFGRYKRGVDIPKAAHSLLTPELRAEMINLFRQAIRVNQESKRGFQKARERRDVELFSPQASELAQSESPLEDHAFEDDENNGIENGNSNDSICIGTESEMYAGEPPEKFPRRAEEGMYTQANGQSQQQQQQQFCPSQASVCGPPPLVPPPTTAGDDEPRPVAVVMFEEIQNFMNELRTTQQRQKEEAAAAAIAKQDQIAQRLPAATSPRVDLLSFYHNQQQETFSPANTMEFTNFSLQLQQNNPFAEQNNFANIIAQQQSQSPLQPQLQQVPQQALQPQMQQINQQVSQQVPQQVFQQPLQHQMQIQPQLQPPPPLQPQIEPQLQPPPPLQPQIEPQLQPPPPLHQHMHQHQQLNSSQLQMLQSSDPAQYYQYGGINPEENQINEYEMQPPLLLEEEEEQQQQQQQQMQQNDASVIGISDSRKSLNTSYNACRFAESEPLIDVQESVPKSDGGRADKGCYSTKNTGKQWSACIKSLVDIEFRTPEKERIAVFTEAAHTCWDFYRESAQYAQILLSESGVPSKYRTIRMGGLGGVAGGVKFMAVNNILFKSPALKKRNGTLYPNYDVAAKVAGHDFKSAIHFLSAVIGRRKGQYKVPLMTLVDYLGYRTVSMTLFPIDKVSLQPSLLMSSSLSSSSSSPLPATTTIATAKQLSSESSLFSSSTSSSPMPPLQTQPQLFVCPVCQRTIYDPAKPCPTCSFMFNPEQQQQQQQQQQQHVMNAYSAATLTRSAPSMSHSSSSPVPAGGNSDSQTLLHGSSDGLLTFCYDPDTSRDLECICAELNLKPHVVRSEDGTERTTSAPFDMEVHRSSADPSDPSRYVVDFSRLFPPVQRPTTPGSAEHLYRLFRPEFVRAYHAPLSCDWAAGGTEAEAEEVARARALLEGPGDDILPFRFARELLRISVQDYPIDELVFRLHARGINVRYLGLVREHLTTKNLDAQHRVEWVCRVSVEMVARSFRKLLNARLRGLVQRRCRESLVSQTIAHYLNSLIGHTASTEQLWELVHADVRTRFVQRGDWAPTLADITACPFGRPTFTELTTKFLGIEYYNDAWRTLLSDAAYNVYEPYNATAIKAVTPRVKQMSLANYFRGRFLHAQAMDMEKSALDQEGFKPPAYLEQSAVKNYEVATLRQPGFRVALRQLALTLEVELSSICTERGGTTAVDPQLAHRADVLREKITFLYKIAKESMPKDPLTIYNMGVFFDLCGDTASARAFYSETLDIRDNFVMCLCSLADSYGFDQSSRDPLRAEELYRHVLQDIVKDSPTTNNLAVLLCTQNRFLEAAKQFCALIEMSSTGLWYGGHNCIAFCKYILRCDDLVQSMTSTFKNPNAF